MIITIKRIKNNSNNNNNKNDTSSGSYTSNWIGGTRGTIDVS